MSFPGLPSHSTTNGGLKAIEMYSLRVHRTEDQNLGVGNAVQTEFVALEIPSHTFLIAAGVAGIPGQSLAHGSIPPLPASITRWLVPVCVSG